MMKAGCQAIFPFSRRFACLEPVERLALSLPNGYLSAMGFYTTDERAAVLDPHQENLTPPSKNRVWDFLTASETCAGFFESQPVESHWEKLPTPTKPVSGMRFYGYRLYIPECGRWASRDPEQEVASVNLFSMCENDCIRNLDPLGLTVYLGGFHVNVYPILSVDGSVIPEKPTKIDMVVDSDQSCVAQGMCSHLTFNRIDAYFRVVYGLFHAHEQLHLDDMQVSYYSELVMYGIGVSGCHKTDAASQCWLESVRIAERFFYYDAMYKTVMNVDIAGSAWKWTVDYKGYRTQALGAQTLRNQYLHDLILKRFS